MPIQPASVSQVQTALRSAVDPTKVKALTEDTVTRADSEVREAASNGRHEVSFTQTVDKRSYNSATLQDATKAITSELEKAGYTATVRRPAAEYELPNAYVLSVNIKW